MVRLPKKSMETIIHRIGFSATSFYLLMEWDTTESRCLFWYWVTNDSIRHNAIRALRRRRRWSPPFRIALAFGAVSNVADVILRWRRSRFLAPWTNDVGPESRLVLRRAHVIEWRYYRGIHLLWAPINDGCVQHKVWMKIQRPLQRWPS